MNRVSFIGLNVENFIERSFFPPIYGNSLGFSVNTLAKVLQQKHFLREKEIENRGPAWVRMITGNELKGKS